MEKYLRLKLRGGVFRNVPPKRSLAMGKVRSKGNRTTEVRLRYALVRAGISGWRLHVPIAGRPDFYFYREKIAIFVDGCFWHGCPKCGHIPKVNQAFWRAKIERNHERGRKWDRILSRQGILPRHVWECDLKPTPQFFVQNLRSVLKKRARR
jgi:DNA mismatch endonuclease (patch repair protein)